MAGEKRIKKFYDEFLDDETVKREGNNVPQYMMQQKQEKGSFFFGKKGDSYVGKPQDCDGHILVVGGAGSGKSSCIAIPTLETWKGTIFAIDIKGELAKYWNHIQRNRERKAKMFNLTKDD